MGKNFICSMFALFSICTSAATFPSMESGRYQEHCEAAWTKKGVIDQGMVNYCMEREREGYYKALQIIKKFENQKWIQDAINHSIKEWTKKGTRQDSMVAHTLVRITDGFEELVLASKKTGFNQVKYQSCYGKWGVQFDMVWYCYQKD